MADCVEGCTEEVAVCVEDFEGHCLNSGGVRWVYLFGGGKVEGREKLPWWRGEVV